MSVLALAATVALVACGPLDRGIVFGSECPDVMYVPTGENVDTWEECSEDTCPFKCGQFVCPNDYLHGVWCEPCEDVEAYREGDGAGLVWSWSPGLWYAYCRGGP